MWATLPWIVGPDLEYEVVTMTAISAGSGPAGGGVLLPGSVLQASPQAGVAGDSAKPLKLGATPAEVVGLSFHQRAPQKVTDVQVAASRSPIAKAPPPGAKATVQVTLTEFEVSVPAGLLTDATTVSVPVLTLVQVKLAWPPASVT